MDYECFRGILSEIIANWGEDVRDEDVMDFPENRLVPALDDFDEFKLYRYTPASYFNIRNFETQTIHLSTNGVMNDVYEGLPETDEPLDYYKVQKLKDLAYMTCFSETNNNILMWSHYANNHEGFCVEYDFRLLKEDAYGILKHLFPIVYDDKRPTARDIASLIESHIELNKAIAEESVYDCGETLADILPMFLMKGNMWSYEKEWRTIFTRKQMYDANDNILYACNLPLKCISGIYLGYRINPEIKKNIIEIVNRMRNEGREVKVYQAKLSPEGYDIVFAEL